MKNQVISQIRHQARIHFKPAKIFYNNQSSYGLKHIVERLLGFYIAEAQFIEAMELDGFEAKACPWKQSGFIYKITAGSVRKAQRFAQETVTSRMKSKDYQKQIINN